MLNGEPLTSNGNHQAHVANLQQMLGDVAHYLQRHGEDIEETRVRALFESSEAIIARLQQALAEYQPPPTNNRRRVLLSGVMTQG